MNQRVHLPSVIKAFGVGCLEGGYIDIKYEVNSLQAVLCMLTLVGNLNTGFLNPYKPRIRFMEHSKQNSPRCDTAKRGVPSGAIVCSPEFHKKKWRKKMKKLLLMPLKKKMDPSK